MSPLLKWGDRRKRQSIIDGGEAALSRSGLVYTCRCGWIDLGHARADGAKGLWKQIDNETGFREDDDGYYVHYDQDMRFERYGIRVRVGAGEAYYIRKGLTDEEKKSVALAIFLDVSHKFESMQGQWPYRWITRSGYSAEDLVSNVVGFYRAVEKVEWHTHCQPVSRTAALQVWDTFGPVGVNKNQRPIPFLYPCSECSTRLAGPVCAALPAALDTIEPAQPGRLFRVVHASKDMPEEARNQYRKLMERSEQLRKRYPNL